MFSRVPGNIFAKTLNKLTHKISIGRFFEKY